MFDDFETEICGSCRQPRIHTCVECGLKYCSICEDQDHWLKCKSFEIYYSEDYGYYLKAIRDLHAGEIIFCELPLVYGPKLPIKEGGVPCVGCCRTIAVEKKSQCPECFWPACSPNCEDLKNDLKHGLECMVLRLQKPTNISVKDFRFEILLPLKILFLQNYNRSEWENLLKKIENKSGKVDSNMNDLSNSHNHTLRFLEENYLIPLKKIEEETGTIVLQNKSHDLLDKIISHVKAVTYKPEGVSLEFFYPTFSLMEKNCLPNSFYTIENMTHQYKITIRANSLISKNTHITVSIINLFQGTYDRLLELRPLNITCSCNRCKDPTEFGTFFSALKCLGTKNEPCGGTQLPLDPTKVKTAWVCDKCQIELPNDQMVKFLKHLETEVVKILEKNATVEELEEFLAKLLMFLHPNHSYVCSVKHALIKLYDEDSVSTKIDICKSLIEIARKFYPNGGLPLAQLILELFQAEFLAIQKKCNLENVASYSADIESLKKTREKLKENVEIFFEPTIKNIFVNEEAKVDSWLQQMSVT